MGVFDFLYKAPRHRNERTYYRRPGQPGSTPGHYHNQRTKTYVLKNSSLPDDLVEQSQAENQQPNVLLHQNFRHRTSTYNPKNAREKINQYYNIQKHQSRRDELDVIDYYNKSKNDVNYDDFTRLSRLEVKINNYITRYNEISDELDNIRTNLNLIFKEFCEEFQEDILGGNKNEHIVEIGERILNKLNSFTGEKYPTKTEDPKQTLESVDSEQKKSHKPMPKHQPIETSTSNNKEPVSEPQSISNTLSSKLVSSQLPPLSINQCDRGLITLNEKNTLPSTIYTIAKAKYAIVNDFAPVDNCSEALNYRTTTITTNKINQPIAISLHSSIPSLAIQHPQTSSPLIQASMDDTFASTRYSPVISDHQVNNNSQNTQLSRRLYLNMSMEMHSDHPMIEYCFRRIEQLRPRIIHYKSEHKLRVYKELDSEISSLMGKLNSINCSKDALFEQDKNVALCELHNLAGALERSIECRDPECVICNSFIYKPEVSV